MPPASSPAQVFWENRIDAVCRRVNLAFWIERAAPVLFFVASAFAVALYAVRRAGTGLEPAWLGLGAAMLLAATAVWWRTRGSFYRRADARVLLEASLRLDTRLTAATGGFVHWPGPSPARMDVLRWRMRAPLGWLAGALAMLLVATLAPTTNDRANSRVATLPPALLEVDAVLSALEETNVADPQVVAELRERENELAQRSADDQLEHSALEAADTLSNEVAAAAKALANNLDSAAAALRAATRGTTPQDAAGRLAGASSGMRSGRLPANSRLMRGLPGSAADLSNMTPEELDRLADQLDQAGDAADGATGNSGKEGKAGRTAKADDAGRGDGNGQGNGNGSGNGNGPGSGIGGTGQGGPGGGGDSAPLTFASTASDAGRGTIEKLDNGGQGSAPPGERLGTVISRPDSDPSQAAGPESAGAVSAAARGSEAVWLNHLTPPEQSAIRRFFQ